MKDLIQKYVGRIGLVHIGDFIVEVEIKDVKQAWGRNRYLVTPVSGKGEAWVESVALKDEVENA